MPKEPPRAISPLGGYYKKFVDVTLSEVIDTAIVSIAFPIDDREVFRKEFAETFETSLPEVGNSSVSKDNRFRFLGLQPGLIFALYDFKGLNPISVITQENCKTGYCTDQSDSWVKIRLAGTKLETILERMCHLDLSPAVFGPGQVTRTVMEHLSTIILCESPESFFFMSPRSSASGFLHSFETSLKLTSN